MKFLVQIMILKLFLSPSSSILGALQRSALLKRLHSLSLLSNFSSQFEASKQQHFQQSQCFSQEDRSNIAHLKILSSQDRRKEIWDTHHSPISCSGPFSIFMILLVSSHTMMVKKCSDIQVSKFGSRN